ncbi:MAG: alpha/beta hydrolase fold domain-containing protein [Pirellulaceae bacterium]
MRGITSLFVFTIAVTTPCCVSSQDTQLRERPRLSFEELLRREDSNKDGKVTRDEFKPPEQLFTRFDRNGDGELTKADFAGIVRDRPSVIGRTPDDVTLLRDVVFGKGGDRDLTMHLVLPKKESDAPMPAYVWVHGGGWQGGSKDGGIGKVVPMVREGFLGATIEYRLTGEAPFPAQIEDCKCAIRYLRAHAKKYNLDVERIAVGGSSAGGHLVALLGTSGGVKELEGIGGWPKQSSAVQAVVDLYGPTDFKAFVSTKGYEDHNRDGSPESKLLGGGEVLSNEAGIKRVDPITYVDKADPPFLIIHGSNDRTVPLNQSEALHRALESADVQSFLHVIDGAGHGGPEFAKPDVNNMQREFLLRYMMNGSHRLGSTPDSK